MTGDARAALRDAVDARQARSNANALVQDASGTLADRHSGYAAQERRAGTPWRLNALLFAATVGSVFLMGALAAGWIPRASLDSAAEVARLGASYALPLLAILLFHEFGHYIAARHHGVPASLPYFIPMPLLSLFGTLGAVIVMPRRIRSARALLDIGAAGPLAGMLVAVPIILYGLSLSEVQPQTDGHYVQEGQSLLYLALKYVVHGHIPAGHDVFLHPTAFAGWTGFLVTFINLIPFGQLDGGHVAYALLGPRHHGLARLLLHLPLALAVYNLAAFAGVGWWRAESGEQFDVFDALSSGSVGMWLVLWGLLHVMKRASGAQHPPVDDEELGPTRRFVAILTLALFGLLFMPSPLVVY